MDATNNLVEKIKGARKRYLQDEAFRIAVDEYAQLKIRKAACEDHLRMMRDYELFEEISPPDVPRQEFVKWCFDAWDEKNEAAQRRSEGCRYYEKCDRRTYVNKLNHFIRQTVDTCPCAGWKEKK